MPGYLPLLRILSCTVAGVLAGQAPQLDNHRARLPASQEPVVACVAADLDGDGLVDLVRAGTSSFGIFLQDRSGRFLETSTVKPTFPGTPPRIVAVATGHVDSLARLDVVVAFRDGTILVYPNTPSGFGKYWQLPPITGSLNPSVAEVMVGDVNLFANGLEEIVVTLHLERPVVFSALGMGTFQQARVVGGPVLAEPTSVLADLNQDQILDLVSVTGNRATPAVPGVWQVQRGVLQHVPGAFATTVQLASRQVRAAPLFGAMGPGLVIAPLGPAGSPLRLFRDTGTGGQLQFALHPAVSAFAVSAPRDLVLADGDGDGLPDAFVIDGSGAVVFGRNQKAYPGTFDRSFELVPAAPQGRLCAVDLEGDGDLDLVVAGEGIEDRLFLGNGTVYGLQTTDTESTGMPVGTLARGFGAAVDLTGEGDRDLAVWDAAGRGEMLENIHGQARFRRVPSGRVPTLPTGTYHTARSAAIRSTARRDVVVLGAVSTANPSGIRILVGSSSGLLDQTSARWYATTRLSTMTVADVVGARPGSAGAVGYSDLVGVDTTGGLVLVPNSSGVFKQSVSISSKPTGLDARILVRDLNLDSLPDLVVLRPGARLRILLANPRVVDTFDEFTPPAVQAEMGLVEDLDGDLLPDLLLAVSPTPGTTKLEFWAGLGTGAFVDRTGTHLPRTGSFGLVSDLVAVRSVHSREVSVVVGQSQGADQILVPVKGIYGAPAPLPFRGSVHSAALLAEDLDLDGDDDLVVFRSDTLPGLLLGQTHQFTQAGGVTQVGRSATLRVALPDARTRGALGIGTPVVRFDLPGLGLVRLLSVPVLLPVPSPSPQLVHEIRLPIPAAVALVPIPMQLLTVDGNGWLRFRNLDLWTPTGH